MLTVSQITERLLGKQILFALPVTNENLISG